MSKTHIMKKLVFSMFIMAFAGLIISCGGDGAQNVASNTPAKTSKEGAKVKLVKNENKGKLQLGDIAPAFSLKNIDGSMVSLADYAGEKGVILTFTCNTCPYAVMYEDRLVALHAKYASQGYPVVAIMPNDIEVKPGDNMDAMKVRAEEKGFEFAYLFDGAQEVYPKYGATKTPHIFLLKNTDDGAKVRYIGAIDDNAQDADDVKVKYLENAIDALEAGKEPEPAFTRAVGCSIKVQKS